MHIAFFIGSMRAGGAERTVTSLSNKFIEFGHYVTIITYDDQYEAFYSIDPRVKREDLAGIKNSKNTVQAIFNNIKNIVLFRRKILKVKPNIILCFSISTLVTCLFASCLLNLKVIGLERSNPYESLNGTVWKKLKRIVSPLADGYVFQTERARQYYPYSVQRKGIVIPNSVNVKVSDLAEPEKRDKTICSVGSLKKAKGFDILLKAFSMALPHIPGYNLVIYGEGPERDNLQKLISELGIEDKVQMPGQSREIIKKISKASLFVLSSRHEGMPNALMEAMACGLPCIAANCPMGPAELLENGENGILVPVDNERAMAEAIIKLTSNPEMAAEIGERAKQIRYTNSIDVIARKYLDYLQGVLG